MAPEAAEALFKGLIYAWLREHGSDARIPDFSAVFGPVSEADRQEARMWFEAARNRVIGTVFYRQADTRLSDTRV